jgi:hypothetical protein
MIVSNNLTRITDNKKLLLRAISFAENTELDLKAFVN